MNKDAIFRCVKETLEKMEIEGEISPNASIMEDLGLESIEVYELLVNLEAALQIHIPEKILMRIDTVQDLTDELEKLCAKARKA